MVIKKQELKKYFKEQCFHGIFLILMGTAAAIVLSLYIKINIVPSFFLFIIVAVLMRWLAFNKIKFIQEFS